MKKWKVPKGYSFLEFHDNDDCIVVYYQNNCNPEDVKAYLVPKEKKATEPVKTYEEGFVAGFSHNIKTVEELERRIYKVMDYVKNTRVDNTFMVQEKYEYILEILRGNNND